MKERAELFLGEGSSADGSQHLYVNMGPAHPAMHGIIRIFAELDGETVVKADVEIGYLHRAFEKDCEAGPYNNAIPYTDRLNYVSPLINNFGYASAIEKLLGIEITERCKYIRVIMSEISRICDHLTCVGASAMELGAFTVFLYMIKAREFLWELVEDVTGARLTISYGRVGGVKADLPAGLRSEGEEGVRARRAQVLEEVHTPRHRQPHLHGPDGRGRRALAARTTIAWGITGPAPARGRRAVRPAQDAALLGVRPDRVRDRRSARTATTSTATWSAWPRWSSPCASRSRRSTACPAAPSRWTGRARPIDPAAYVDLGKQGKTEGLLLLPIKLSPNLQGQDRGAHERVNAPDKRVVLPPKAEAYGSIEGLMNHFMLVMEGYGIRPPPGEAYFAGGGRQR